MTEGWKGERNCMQKTTVGTVDIKTSLGGEKKRRESESRIRRQKRCADYEFARVKELNQDAVLHRRRHGS
jgi:hypothetical protein